MIEETEKEDKFLCITPECNGTLEIAGDLGFVCPECSILYEKNEILGLDELIDEDKCGICEGTDFKMNPEGIPYCASCGGLLDDIDYRINSKPPRRIYDFKEDENKLCNEPFPEITSTTFSPDNKIKTIGGRSVYSLNLYSKNIISNYDRSLLTAFPIIERVCSNMGIERNSNTRMLIKEKYKSLIKQGVIKGRTIEGAVAVSIYDVIKSRGYPCSRDELIKELGIGKNIFNSTLNALIINNGIEKVKYSSSKPTIEKVISECCDVFNINENIQKDIKRKVYDFIKNTDYQGKDPKGIAATGVYLTLLEKHIKEQSSKVSQKNIALTANVSEVTIRNRIKEFFESGIFNENEMGNKNKKVKTSNKRETKKQNNKILLKNSIEDDINYFLDKNEKSEADELIKTYNEKHDILDTDLAWACAISVFKKDVNITEIHSRFMFSNSKYNKTVKQMKNLINKEGKKIESGLESRLNMINHENKGLSDLNNHNKQKVIGLAKKVSEYINNKGGLEFKVTENDFLASAFVTLLRENGAKIGRGKNTFTYRKIAHDYGYSDYKTFKENLILFNQALKRIKIKE